MHYVTFNDWFGKINAFRMDVQAGDKYFHGCSKYAFFSYIHGHFTSL